MKAALAVFSRWGLTNAEGAAVLGEQGEEFLHDLRAGSVVLRSRDSHDKVTTLIRLYEGVFGLFGNPEVERRWIREPQSELQGESVFSLITEGSFVNLLRAQAYVDFVNGR